METLSVCDIVSPAKIQTREVLLSVLYEVNSECHIWSHIHQSASVCLCPVCHLLSVMNPFIGPL